MTFFAFKMTVTCTRRFRIWSWLLVSSMVMSTTVIARDSRKEPNLRPVSLGVNVLGNPVQGQEGHINSNSNHGSQDPDINIDYDYFMFGLQKTGNLPNPSQTSDVAGHSEKVVGTHGMNHTEDYYYYDYGGDTFDYKDGGGYNQEQKVHNPDPFSVFYDSLFSVDEADDGHLVEIAKQQQVDKSTLNSPQPPRRQNEVYSTTEASPPQLSYYPLPTVASRRPPLVPNERPIQRPPPPPPVRRPQYNYTSVPQGHPKPSAQAHQKPLRPRPGVVRPKPVPSKAQTPTESKPMDLTHLKVLMPKILEKFGLPKTFGEEIFKNEAALQETLLQIMKDSSFRNALSMIPKFDLLNMDMTGLLGILSTVDPSVIISMIKKADLSRFSSMMSNLGIDMSYLSGIFNRGGAAAQYSTQESDDDSKLIYIPILETGSVDNVQMLGFVIIMFFLLATAYAYLEYGFFTQTARKDGPIEPSGVTNEQLLHWGEASDIWLPAVEAIEEQHWNPPPPIHILRPTTPEPTKAPNYVPSYPRRPYRPIRRRFRPKYRRRYYQRYHPKREGLAQEDPQEMVRLTRRRPMYRPIERSDDDDVDYYDDYYDYYDDYYYDDEHYDYDLPTARERAGYDRPTAREREDRPQAGSLTYKYYPASERSDHPYPYYFPGPRATEEGTKSTTSRSTTKSTTTTTSPPTRPTSRYADTIRTGKPTGTNSASEKRE